MEMKIFLLLVSDSSETLRPMDVDRVMESANNNGQLEEFRAWILSQPLLPRTKKAIEEWENVE